MKAVEYGAITGGRILESYYDDAHLSNLIYEALDFGFESIQIFPNQIEKAKKLLEGKNHVPLCAVITYPHGTFLASQKTFEIIDAINRGADQVEVVLNVVNVRSGEWDKVKDELTQCRKAAGTHVLKFIVEAEYLTDEMLEQVCRLAAETGADRLSTSIGVYPMVIDGKETVAGANEETVRKMKTWVNGKVQISAMGIIDNAEKFKSLLEAGADYICTEYAAKILRELKGERSDV